MDGATTYQEWLQHAEALDELEGGTAWRHEDESACYPAAALRRQLVALQRLRNRGEARALAALLVESVEHNFADLVAPELYLRTRTGETKLLIEQYLEEAERAILYLAATPIPGTSVEEKRQRFGREARRIGRAALLLSGGASWGLYHLGGVRALLQQGLLPEVISGASLGAMIAAGACTRTTAELEEVLARPELFDLHTLQLFPFRQMLAERALFDPQVLLRNMRANIPDLTFAEAHARSGRTLVIPLAPTRERRRPQVLSHLNAPDALVCPAAAASCALPGIYPALSLVARGPGGFEVPFRPGELWRDGSLGADLPITHVARLHDVSLFIVSQMNCYVVALLPGRSRSVGLLQGGARLAGRLTLAQCEVVLDVLRRRVGSPLLRPLFELAHAMASQPYQGDITIYPRFDLRMLPYILANPTKARMRRYVLEGERATWPRLPLIRNRTRLARAVEQGLALLDRLAAEEAAGSRQERRGRPDTPGSWPPVRSSY